jgi:hypothetical protein
MRSGSGHAFRSAPLGLDGDQTPEAAAPIRASGPLDSQKHKQREDSAFIGLGAVVYGRAFPCGVATSLGSDHGFRR